MNHLMCGSVVSGNRWDKRRVGWLETTKGWLNSFKLHAIKSRAQLRGALSSSMEERNELTAVAVGETPRRESGEVPEQRGSWRRPRAPGFSLFYSADRLDCLLMFIGSIGCCIHGAMLPVFFLLFGKLIDSLGSLSSSPDRLSVEVSKICTALQANSVWQLTLVTLAVVPLIVIAGGTYAVVMAGLAKKGESAYAEAQVSGEIEFHEVSFSYPSRKNMIFEGLNLSITAGRTTAVVGQSGSGKSTVVSMIERFFKLSDFVNK